MRECLKITMSNVLLDDDLPKWCRLVVVGDAVSEDQAAEIILRTSDLYFVTNDKEWQRQLHAVLNINHEKSSNCYYYPSSDDLANANKSLGVLDIEYLQNMQIASCYIDGAKGWCAWDGHIGCDGYNIGKWPSVSKIFAEWELIAAAFPFLKLRCQIWNCEYGADTDDVNESPKPVAEFIVENGTVSLVNPTKKLKHPCPTSSFPKVLTHHGERCCTIECFKRAIELTKASMNK